MPHCGAEDFRRTSRENIARGVDFLKVFMTKVINATPFIYHFLTLEELRAVVEEAKSVNITTACHCSGGQGLDDCLTAGIDCLEHVYYITQPQVERVKKEDRWVVYTPSYALNDQLLFKFSPHDREGSLREKEIICKCLSGAIEGGLKFGIGTDRAWRRKHAISLAWALKTGMYWPESQSTRLGSAGQTKAPALSRKEKQLILQSWKAIR